MYVGGSEYTVHAGPLYVRALRHADALLTHQTFGPNNANQWYIPWLASKCTIDVEVELHYALSRRDWSIWVFAVTCIYPQSKLAL